MTELAKCCEECEPVMQVRGGMAEGDYFGIISDGGGNTSAQPAGAPAIDHHLFVVVTDNNKNDVRIACRKCAMASSWLAPDGPGMPGIGKEYCAKLWTDKVADKNMRAGMLKSMTDQFGEAAVKKFFKHSL